MKFQPHEIVIYQNEVYVIAGGHKDNYYIQKGTLFASFDVTMLVKEYELEKIPEGNDILKDLCLK